MTLSEGDRTWQWCEGIVDKEGGTGRMERRSFDAARAGALQTESRYEGAITSECAPKGEVPR